MALSSTRVRHVPTCCDRLYHSPEHLIFLSASLQQKSHNFGIAVPRSASQRRGTGLFGCKVDSGTKVKPQSENSQQISIFNFRSVDSAIQLCIDLLHSISDERMRCNAICQVQAHKHVCQPLLVSTWVTGPGFISGAKQYSNCQRSFLNELRRSGQTVLESCVRPTTRSSESYLQKSQSYIANILLIYTNIICRGKSKHWTLHAAWHVPRNRKRTSSMWPCHAARSKGVSPARPDVETTGAEQDLQLQCCNHSHTVMLTMHKESRNTLDSAIAVQNVHKLTVQTAQVSQEPLGPIGPRLDQPAGTSTRAPCSNKKRSTSKCPCRAARWAGQSPPSVARSLLAPCSISKRTTSWKIRERSDSEIFPAFRQIILGNGRNMKKSAHCAKHTQKKGNKCSLQMLRKGSNRPWREATCNGVAPSVLAASPSAPTSNKSVAASEQPFCAA